MNALHILNRTADHPAFSQCMQALGKNSLLLIEDAVYELQNSQSDIWKLSSSKVFALAQDVTARGVTPATSTNLLVEQISYETFVELTTQHSPIVSWY